MQINYHSKIATENVVCGPSGFLLERQILGFPLSIKESEHLEGQPAI